MPANTREIRGQITSIQGTQKITRAMEMVAASKMRKAQELMGKAQPYANEIRRVIGHLAAGHPEYRHPYLIRREPIKRVGYIVVTSDRGLCGGLNINLLRYLLQQMQQETEQSIEHDLCLIGRKGIQYFRRFGGRILGSADHLGDEPRVGDLIGIVKTLLDQYDSGELDAIYIASNQFVNTMQQRPYIQPLLPLPAEEHHSLGHWDYIYEPDSADVLLGRLLVRYVESQVYRAVAENNACFQAAQMVAMKNATDNAGELIDHLRLAYNKARQASITQEISEIVGGAEAID